MFGGAGRDGIHAGSGDQVLDGGAGDDTIWAGSGQQILRGGDGDDMLRVGSGRQTIDGGAGHDTIVGGAGASLLDGAAGRDVLVAGGGNETLHGGSGRDVFKFGSGSGRDVIADFDVRRDTLQVARDVNGSGVVRADDLRPRIGSGPGGDAVLNLGGGATVTLLHVCAGMLETCIGTALQVAPA